MTRAPALAIACVLTAGPAAGQGQPTFHAAVDLVELDVSVMKGGSPVRDLRAADFVVLDNGERQAVDVVSVEQVPLHFVAVLDTSASVAGAVLENLRSATHAAVHALRPGDLASFVVFSHELTIRRWPVEQADQVDRFLDGLDANGATALYDAIHAATLLPVPAGLRTALLVFSDGKDSASWLSADGALDAVRRSDVVVHVVSAAGQQRGFLDDLVRAGGGRRWEARNADELPGTFLRVLDDLRVRYRLTFALPAAPAPGWHELDVSTRVRGATVTARPGYFVP